MVDSLRYSWNKLKQLVLDVQAYLGKVQPTFKNDLISTVQKFGLEVSDFAREYNEKGPMVITDVYIAVCLFHIHYRLRQLHQKRLVKDW